MWPFNQITEAVKSRRVRRECLDEILEAARTQGIAFTSFLITANKSPPGYDNSLIDKLEKLKKGESRYLFHFNIRKVYGIPRASDGVEIRELEAAPRGYFKIGLTQNPDYEAEMANYALVRFRVKKTLSEMASSADGTWCITIEYRLLDDKQKAVCCQGQDTQIRVSGPNNEHWIREQEEFISIRKRYEDAFEKWQNTPLEVWQARASAGEICGACGGSGEVSVPRNDINGYIYDSGPCNCQNGRVYCPVDEVIQRDKPLEPRLSFIQPSQKQCIQEANRRGLDVKIPNNPYESANVYLAVYG